jgi:hypothetical protein
MPSTSTRLGRSPRNAIMAEAMSGVVAHTTAATLEGSVSSATTTRPLPHRNRNAPTGTATSHARREGIVSPRAFVMARSALPARTKRVPAMPNGGNAATAKRIAR